MIGETYGKMPDAGAENQIIMEYEHYMNLFAQSTTFDKKHVDEKLGEHLLSWIQTESNLAYFFSNQIVTNLPSPRYEYYENSDFNGIKDDLLHYLYPIINNLGLFNMDTNLML